MLSFIVCILVVIGTLAVHPLLTLAGLIALLSYRIGTCRT